MGGVGRGGSCSIVQSEGRKKKEKQSLPTLRISLETNSFPSLAQSIIQLPELDSILKLEVQPT